MLASSTTDDKLARFAEIALKSGRILVSPDVYDSLLPSLVDGKLPESMVVVEKCDYLGKGEMIACDFSLLNTIPYLAAR